MKEFAKNFINEHLVDSVVKDFAAKIRRDGLQSVLEGWFRAYRMEVHYSSRGRRKLPELRDLLNSHPGVIISNHPNYFDIPAILQTLEADTLKRFKVMVYPAFYKSFVKYLGKDDLGSEIFVPASRNIDEVQSLLMGIHKHVQDGGLFLIFPSGGKDAKYGKLIFMNFFRELIMRLDDSDMIYPFYVEPADVHRLFEKFSKPGMYASFASLPFLPPEKNLVSLFGKGLKNHLYVEELYTEVAEWRGALRSLGAPLSSKLLLTIDQKRLANETLAQYYMDLFGKDQSNFQYKY